MTDVKLSNQGGPGNGLKLDAVPFVPLQTLSERPSSTLTLNAAPFIPSSSVASHEGNGSAARPQAPGADYCRTSWKKKVFLCENSMI